jgi:hypothetical protein
VEKGGRRKWNQVVPAGRDSSAVLASVSISTRRQNRSAGVLYPSQSQYVHSRDDARRRAPHQVLKGIRLHRRPTCRFECSAARARQKWSSSSICSCPRSTASRGRVVVVAGKRQKELSPSFPPLALIPSTAIARSRARNQGQLRPIGTLVARNSPATQPQQTTPRAFP